MKSLSTARLYGILDLGYVAPADAERVAAQLCEGGVDVLQLRAKGLDELEIEALGQGIEPITRAAGVPLIVNDFPALVPSIGAQGAHIGQDDGAVEDARWRAGGTPVGTAVPSRPLAMLPASNGPLGTAVPTEVQPPLIGRSTHSVEQAIAAQAEGADYIGFGPLFPTPTKPGRPAIGLADIRRVHELVSIPIFCIGGINPENLDAVLDAGARRVVIVSALLQAPDIAKACRAVKRRIADCGLRIAD